jgi:hypothetical protein
MSEDAEVYLGDGLFVSFDGYSVILRAPREHGDHFVALEPEVLKAFCVYLEGLAREHGKVAT